MVTDLFTIEFGAEKPFLAGPENQAAACASTTFCDRWEDISPLVLHGPPMSGKSLLARGITARWRSIRPDDKVFAWTGRDYAREFAQACRVDTVDMFSQRVRTCDLFVLDAIDELADKVAARQHLCRTLDALHRRQAACIVTSRTLPGQQREFSPDLVSRLSAGLCIAVAMPAKSTRRQLVEQVARDKGIDLTSEACGLIGDRISGGVLPIENAVARIASRFGGEFSPAILDDLLGDDCQAPHVSLKRITSITAKLCGLRVGDLRSASRRTSHVRARGLAMLAARQRTDLSLNAIGKYFGGRDHTTVMHACDKTTQRIDDDQQLQLLWEELTAKLDEHRSSPEGSSDPVAAGENVSIACSSRS